MYSILLSKMEIGFPIVEKRLKKIIKKNSKVIIIPWSFPNETDKIGLNEYYDKKIKPKYEKILIDFGIDKKNIKHLNCYNKNIKMMKKYINESDVLILPGGNPEMFFSKIVHETELLYVIKHYKKIIIGVSAGACLHFKRYFITAKNNYYNYFAFYDGFGILNNSFLIDVHSSNNKLYFNKLRNISKEYMKDVYAIYNDGAIIVNRKNNNIEMFGNVLKIDNK